MSLTLIAFTKSLILPPTINFILVLLGLLIVRRSRAFGYGLQAAGFFSLLVLSLEPVAYTLIKRIEQYPPLGFPVSVSNEQAIVVLSGDIDEDAPEFLRSIDSEGQLRRLRYAAFLHEQTGLPVLVSGGHVSSERVSEAVVMAQTLKNIFNVQDVWQEQQAKNTAENAMYSANLLRGQGVETVFLVTHAWHMPRAVAIFERQDIAVTPAPTGFSNRPDYDEPDTYLPSVYALETSVTVLHEYLGRLWYRLRY